MKTFIQRFGSKILGVLHGFDRIRFRGTRRFLANVAGMLNFLWHRQVLLKDFKAFAGVITAEVRQAAEEVALKQGRPIEYLHNSVMDKEAWVRQLAKRDGIQQGLIGVLKAVECCWSYEVGPNRAKKKLELRGKPSKCLHYYHYFMDPEVGLVYVRLQTWFPFSVHVGMNGREWLQRQMDKIGLAYRRRDNCFTWIEDWVRAQQLMNEQLRTDWPGLLNRLLDQANAALGIIDPSQPTPYYWSMDEGEWASDLAFGSPKTLAKLAPRLFRHAWLNFDSGDVMRFLGTKAVTAQGPHGNFAGEVVSDLKRRVEGTAHQASAQRQLDQDVRQARLGAACRNGDQPNARHESVSHARKGTKTERRVGNGCVKAWPTSIDASRSARRPTTAMSRRWRVWTTAARWRSWPRRYAERWSGKANGRVR